MEKLLKTKIEFYNDLEKDIIRKVLTKRYLEVSDVIHYGRELEKVSIQKNELIMLHLANKQLNK